MYKPSHSSVSPKTENNCKLLIFQYRLIVPKSWQCATHFQHHCKDTIQDRDKAILSIYAEDGARTRRARYSYEESKEETKEEEDNEMYNAVSFRATFSTREIFEESKEETKEDDEFGHRPGFQPCLAYYDEEVEFDPKGLASGLENFRIVTHGDGINTTPPISWIIQAIYNNWQELRFKLKTPEGAYMLLYAEEIIDCVLILVDDDDDDGSAYFQIEDLYGNILFADCDQVEAHILYIISTETRKRQASIERDVSCQPEKPKRRRKYSQSIVAGVRKLSEMMKHRRGSSQSS